MEAGRLCFGYGSLVNRDTHDFGNSKTVTLAGWRRSWSHRISSNGRFASSLNIEPAPNVTISGLISHVAPNQFAALDAREAGYNLVKLDHGSLDQPQENQPVFTYVSADYQPGDADHPILQSYLDTVLLGFFTELGEQGVSHFFDTTSGWEAPIRADRSQPEYPRTTPITADFANLIDNELKKLGATWIAQAL